MKKESNSTVLRDPLNEFLKRTGVTKKALAVDMKVSQQTITDWTKEREPKPVTADNSTTLAKVTNDSPLAQTIGYFYLGLPPAMSGEYRLDLADLDDLREIEEDERDAKQRSAEIRRILLKQSTLTGKAWDSVLDLAREQMEVCIVNNQYLFALCERLGISSMDLVEMFMDRWKREGFFGGE